MLELDRGKVKTFAQECNGVFGNVSESVFENLLSQIKDFGQDYPHSIKIGIHRGESKYFVVAFSEREVNVSMMVDFYNTIIESASCNDILFCDRENAFLFWWD